MIATMPYIDYLRLRDNLNDAYMRGHITQAEWKERRFMLEAQYWLGI